MFHYAPMFPELTQYGPREGLAQMHEARQGYYPTTQRHIWALWVFRFVYMYLFLDIFYNSNKLLHERHDFKVVIQYV